MIRMPVRLSRFEYLTGEDITDWLNRRGFEFKEGENGFYSLTSLPEGWRWSDKKDEDDDCYNLFDQDGGVRADYDPSDQTLCFN